MALKTLLKAPEDMLLKFYNDPLLEIYNIVCVTIYPGQLKLNKMAML